MLAEVIEATRDDQRSAPNICALPSRLSNSSTRCDIQGGTGSCASERRSGFPHLFEYRAPLPRRMATSTSASPSAKPTDHVPTKKRQAQSLALPCPSNAVRACVAGTKYSVGEMKIHLQVLLNRRGAASSSHIAV